MNALATLLLILFGGAIVIYFAYKIHKILGDILVLALAFGSSAFFLMQADTTQGLAITIGGIKLLWSFSGYARIFALLVALLSPLTIMYSLPYMKGRDRLGWFYMLFVFVIGAMYGILMAQDWVSLFIFWEIMTWSSYLLVIYDRQANPAQAGLKYVVFSVIGAYAMFTAIVLLATTTGSIYIAETINHFGALNINTRLLIGILLLIGFGVKAAVMPLHVWAPDAYSTAPMSFTSLFSGALSKMGIYGIGLVTINLFSHTGMSLTNNIFAWIGAITAVLATFYAIVQDDAKKLMAWSSVAQLGYIVTGLAIGTKLAVFAAIYLALLHAAFKGTLFMAIGAVERQAGTTKFSELRALIRKMPYTFFSALLSVIALAAVPPIAGFVGKWMLYEALITDGHYWVVILLFLSSTAAFLYAYRFLFGVFLGQEEKEFENVKEAPVLMVLPMLLMALFLLVAGTLPGFVFKPIAQGMKDLGFTDVTYHMSILTNNWGDIVDLRYVTGSLIGTALIFLVIITWVNFKHTRAVGTKDIHTAGEPPSEDDNYHFALDFFRPFQRAIEPVYKASVTTLYNVLGRAVEETFQFVRRFYTGNGQTYALYVLIFLALLIFFANQIF